MSFMHPHSLWIMYNIMNCVDDSMMQEFNAKLSDFGLAKAGPTGDRSHVSTRVLGTEGYAAPEYIATGHTHTLKICFLLKLN